MDLRESMLYEFPLSNQMELLIRALVFLCSEVMDLLADKFTGTPRPQPTKFAIKAKIYVVAAGQLITSNALL